ncbi:MAG: DNA polymerase III subunit delta [Boseongicola sp.]|nr:DNA polymerase III subunit delta [Boseongicola sp.]MDD9979689.1 DNA polymerase III subunit delta [Boseongicola sp.]
MKLSTRDAAAYFKRPDTSKSGLLIYGADAMRVALRRQEVIKALIGENGEEEMRLTRIAGPDLRKDPALLLDAVKAQGFFPGPRVAFVEDAADGLSATILGALSEWKDGDAHVIVTAGQLAARSKLRKAFEDDPSAYAVGIYDDPPGRDEIERSLKEAGLNDISQDAMSALIALSRDLGPGDFRQTIEKIGLFKIGDDLPLNVEDVEACAPQSIEAGIDDVLNVTADGEAHKIGPVLRRLEAQGVGAVGLCIGATRHFKTLHTVASDPGGPGAGIGKLRPPVFGPRRGRIQRQASSWGMHKLERALTLLLDTDLTLRSTARVPEMALMERTLLRIAWMNRR